MGLFFTLFYILIAYLSPQTLFGPLSEYHLEVIVLVIAMIVTLPSIHESNLLSLPQTYAALGLTASVALSMIFSGWPGGALPALLNFAPSAMLFFLIVVNCTKKIHLQLLVGVLLFCVLFTILRGYMALEINDRTSVYLISMKNSTGELFYRVRGVTFLNDPNDLAQVIAGLIPCVFLYWGKGKIFRNLFMVILPVGALVYGMYLTHSRGGMLALMAVIIVTFRRKLGIVPALMGAGLVYLALSATGFTGGRELSSGAGEDRMDAWATGLQLIRSHPIFGVGYKRFTDFHELTAHNTVVVCAAELGLVGFFFWMLFTLPSVRDMYVGSTLKKVKKKSDADDQGVPSAYPARRASAAEPIFPMGFSGARLATPDGAPVAMRSAALPPGNSPDLPVPSLDTLAPSAPMHLQMVEDTDTLSPAEAQRMSSVMLVAFAGFLTAGWFLSRAYTTTLFINAGMAAAIYKMARDRGVAPPPLSFGRASKLTAVACVGFIIFVWMLLRVHHL